MNQKSIKCPNCQQTACDYSGEIICGNPECEFYPKIIEEKTATLEEKVRALLASGGKTIDELADRLKMNRKQISPIVYQFKNNHEAVSEWDSKQEAFVWKLCGAQKFETLSLEQKEKKIIDAVRAGCHLPRAVGKQCGLTESETIIILTRLEDEGELVRKNEATFSAWFIPGKTPKGRMVLDGAGGIIFKDESGEVSAEVFNQARKSLELKNETQIKLNQELHEKQKEVIKNKKEQTMAKNKPIINWTEELLTDLATRLGKTDLAAAELGTDLRTINEQIGGNEKFLKAWAIGYQKYLKAHPETVPGRNGWLAKAVRLGLVEHKFNGNAAGVQIAQKPVEENLPDVSRPEISQKETNQGAAPSPNSDSDKYEARFSNEAEYEHSILLLNRHLEYCRTVVAKHIELELTENSICSLKCRKCFINRSFNPRPLSIFGFEQTVLEYDKEHRNCQSQQMTIGVDPAAGKDFTVESAIRNPVAFIENENVVNVPNELSGEIDFSKLNELPPLQNIHIPQIGFNLEKYLPTDEEVDNAFKLIESRANIKTIDFGNAGKLKIQVDVNLWEMEDSERIWLSEFITHVKKFEAQRNEQNLLCSQS